MTKGKKIQFCTLFLSCMILFSCTSYKKIPYLQGGEGEVDAIYKINAIYSEITFQPQDELIITVNSPLEPGAASVFNMPLTQNQLAPNMSQTYYSVVGRDYLIDDNGDIEFPVLGKLHIAGLTRKGLESYLKSSLKPYLNEDPIITINYKNHQISVLGEVNHPGSIPLVKDKVNLFEALALAGDLTIQGKRDNIVLMRKLDNSDAMSIAYLDISSKDVLQSPYFYVQPNDILYVQPTKSKTLAPDRESIGFWFSLWSMAMSAVTVIVVLVK